MTQDTIVPQGVSLIKKINRIVTKFKAEFRKYTAINITKYVNREINRKKVAMPLKYFSRPILKIILCLP